jgi:hypothetical protein
MEVNSVKDCDDIAKRKGEAATRVLLKGVREAGGLSRAPCGGGIGNEGRHFRVSEDRILALDKWRDDFHEVFCVVLGIVCRWRGMLALAVPTEVEKHAAIFWKPSGHQAPDATVTAVAVQAKASQGTRGLRARRRLDDLVSERRSSTSDPKFTGPVPLVLHKSKIGARRRSVKRLSPRQLI